MAQPKRHLPAVRDVPWNEFRQRATAIFLMLQAGWTALSEAEREEVRRLLAKRPAAQPDEGRGQARRQHRGEGRVRRRRSSASTLIR